MGLAFLPFIRLFRLSPLQDVRTCPGSMVPLYDSRRTGRFAGIITRCATLFTTRKKRGETRGGPCTYAQEPARIASREEKKRRGFTKKPLPLPPASTGLTRHYSYWSA